METNVDKDKKAPRRSVDEEKKAINAYLTNMSQYDKDLVNKQITKMKPMHENCRVAINIPAYHEEKIIYGTLDKYTKQVSQDGKTNLDPSMYEINVIVNREENRGKDKTYEEVARFVRDNPQYNINVIEQVYPVGR